MSMPRALVLAFLVLLPAGSLGAQSASYIDIVLGTERLSYADAAYLLLRSAGDLSEDLSPAEAVRFLEDRGWGLRRHNADRAVTLGGFSLLIMRVFELRGGPMYSLFPVRRYALRELRFRGIVQGRGAPGSALSGERALRILERTVRRYQGDTQ